MIHYEILVSNEILTDTKDDDELETIFNDKLAALIAYYDSMKIEGCNYEGYHV